MNTTLHGKDAVDTEKAKEKVIFDREEYLLRKRLPPRYPSRANDVYINNKTNFKAQLARCFKCLEYEDCVQIHGLGAAVSIAINLALQVQLKSVVPIDIAVNTSTVDLIDDLEPQIDTAAFQYQRRQNSAVHIQLSKSLKMTPADK